MGISKIKTRHFLGDFSFDANCINNRHQIKWTTTSELNNDFSPLRKVLMAMSLLFSEKYKAAEQSMTLRDYMVSAEDGIAEYYKLKNSLILMEPCELKTIYAPSCQNDMFKLLSVNQVEEVVNSIVSSPDNVKQK